MIVHGRTHIARQGEVGTGFFIIVGGGAHVRDGQTIATIGPGDFFELSVLDGRPRSPRSSPPARPRLALASTRGRDHRAAHGGTRAPSRPAERLRALTEAGRH